MEPDSSLPTVPPEHHPSTLPTLGLEPRVTMIDQGSIERFMTHVREQALGVIDIKRRYKEYEEAFARMERTVRKNVREAKMREEECEIKQSLEADVMRLVLEMQMEELVGEVKELMVEKGEELKKEVQGKREELEAKEKELCLSITEKTNELKKKEEEFEMKQEEETRGIDVKRKALEVKEKSLEEMMRELEVRKQELEERHKELGLTMTEKSSELKKKEEEFQVKQDEEARDIEVKRQSLEVKEKNLEELMTEIEVRKQKMEERQKNLSLLDETIKGKANELEKRNEKQEAESKEIEEKRKSLEVKEKNFEEQMRELETRQKEHDETIKGKVTELENKTLKQEAEAKEIEVKMNSLEVKEKQLKEREGLLELKEKECANRSKSRKRCRDEFGPAFASTSRAKRIETHKVSCKDDRTDEEGPEPHCCPDADFNNFNTTMSSFAVGQIWAIYDPLDLMPRYYARIRKILEPQQRVGVRWLEPKQTAANKKTAPISCGEFKYGGKTTSSRLVFSHEIDHVRTTGKKKKSITINPREGETWALFSGWSRDNNSKQQQQKRPYKYDFVRVLSDDLDSDDGIGVAYLARVEGFTSVYKLAEQHGVLQMMISSDEMLMFSHRVPSFELTGDETKGVPAGSFELDPAAIPKDCLDEALKVKQERA